MFTAISAHVIAFATLLLTAIAALVSSIVAVKSLGASKRSLSADLCMRLEDRFDSVHIKSCRSRAAKSLLTHSNVEEAEDVLDFFETTGLLVRLKALNLEMVYSSFFHWANTYWNAAKPHIDLRRKTRKTLWQEFEYLYRKMIEIEKRKDASSVDLSPTPQLIEGNLVDEKDIYKET
ncbi:MAG TPA: hypothetical protein VGY31_04490 [Terriglobia bacterium]|nr:hypothetical protein [Terriglobia bacterium]